MSAATTAATPSVVLFDAIGTLIETRSPVGEIYAAAAARQGVQISAWRLEDAFRRIFATAPNMAFPSAPVDAIAALERDWWRARVRSIYRAAESSVLLPDFDACFEELFSHYAESDAWQLREGAKECLATLRSRSIATGIVSNCDVRLERVLAGLHIRDALDVVVLPAHAGATKPDSAPFRLALEQLGATPAQTVYVGDDPVQDMDGARALGLRAFDVSELATLRDLPSRLIKAPE